MSYFQFFVTTIEGKNLIFGQAQSLSPDSKVSKLFEEVAKRTGITNGEFRLAFLTKQLEKDSPNTLKDYGIQSNSTVYLLLRVRGGNKQ